MQVFKTNLDKKGQAKISFNRSFLSNFLKLYISILNSIKNENQDSAKIDFCCKSLELMIDLQSQLLTRRFFDSLIKDHLIISISKFSFLFNSSPDSLFRQMISRLIFYNNFEIDLDTGMALNSDEITRSHYKKISLFQRLAFTKYHSDMLDFSLDNVASIDTVKSLTDFLMGLKPNVFISLCKDLLIRTSFDGKDVDTSIAIDAIVSEYARRESQIVAVEKTSLFPDEVYKFNQDFNAE